MTGSPLPSDFLSLCRNSELPSPLLEVLPVGVVVVDAQGYIQYLNPLGQTLLWGGPGSGPHPEVGQLLNERCLFYQVTLEGTRVRYPPDRLPHVRAAILGKAVVVEDLAILRGEEVMVLEVRATPLPLGRGQETCIVMTLQDISARVRLEVEHTLFLKQQIAERTQAEAALKQSEAARNQLLQSIPDLIIWMNVEGVILGLIAGESISLHTPVEATGHSIHELLPPNLVAQRMVATRQALETGETQLYEQQIVLNGVLCYEEVRVVPVAADEVLVLVRDISDRKRIEVERQQAAAEIKAQQEFLYQVLDAVPTPVFVRDREGRYVILNRAGSDLYGIASDQLIGKTELDLGVLSPQQFQEFIAVNQRVMDHLQPVVIKDEAIARKSGDLRWYQTRISPFFNEAGQAQGVIGTSSDITQLKQTQTALQQAKETAEAANRAKNTFLANMSHELRTPLNAILGFSQLMSYDANLSTQQKNNLRIIRSSGEHLLRLINQVLDLSKIEAGHIALYISDFDLYQLLEDVEGMFSLKAKEKGLTLEVSKTPDVPPYIRTDKVKLQQILINLLSNAVKFTRSGRVSLQVSRPLLDNLPAPTIANTAAESPPFATALCFDVIDTGMGIAPEEFSGLFEAFVQTRAGQQSQEGTGLGLAISNHCVELLGGSITVSSQGHSFSPGAKLPGGTNGARGDRGATFRVILPVQVVPDPSPKERSQEAELVADIEVGNSVVVLPLDRITLCPQWLNQFHQATVEGDLARMLALIEQLRPEHGDLAQQLLWLVNHYQFEQLLTLTQPDVNA